MSDKKSLYSAVIAIDFGTSGTGVVAKVRTDRTAKGSSAWKTTGHVEFSAKKNLKTLTAVLLENDGKLVAFGEDAQTIWSGEDLEHKAPDGSLYFHRFKMALMGCLGYNEEMKVPDHTGVKHDAEKVFGAALKRLVELGKNLLRVQAFDKQEKILWVLTVPAIWSEHSRNCMAHWLELAGVSKDDIQIVLEPEAASMFCIQAFGDFKAKVPYILLDCGGGTIDGIAHYLDASKQGVHELIAPFGNDGGSLKIDDAFETLFCEILGRDFIERLRAENLWSPFLRAFVSTKELWGLGELERKKTLHAIDFDLSLINEEMAKHKPKGFSSIEEFAAGNSDGFAYNGRFKRLLLKSVTMQRLFDPSLNKIKSLLQEILEPLRTSLAAEKKAGRIDSAEIKHLFLVGGLCQSPYIQDEVAKWLKEQKIDAVVKQPKDSISAVLQGALGLGESTTYRVKTRKAPATLYVLTHVTKQVDDEDKVCEELYPLIQTGDHIAENAKFSYHFKPFFDSTKSVIVRLFQSPKKGATSRTDSNVREVARVNINAEELKEAIEIELELSYLHGTVLAFSAKTQASRHLDCTLYLHESGDLASKGVAPELHHLIFVIDCSGSMDSSDIKPMSADFPQNRLGAVCDAVSRFLSTRDQKNEKYSLITFNHLPTTVFAYTHFDEKTIKDIPATGGTSFSMALQRVISLIDRIKEKDVKHRILFLSDGEDGCPDDILEKLKLKSGLTMSTISFRSGKSAILEKMATELKGTYKTALDVNTLDEAMYQFGIQFDRKRQEEAEKKRRELEEIGGRREGEGEGEGEVGEEGGGGGGGGGGEESEEEGGGGRGGEEEVAEPETDDEAE